MLVINSYCHIKNNRLYLNGKLLFEDAESTFLKTFAVKAFKHFKFKYPKFYKMDEISKLGFLAAEVLLMEIDENLKNHDVGIVLSNSHSTLVTDTDFQITISNEDEFYPSPSVFVYTLPNIMIGEISIRHKFRGENAFFIFERFNAEFINEYIEQLSATNKITSCMGGWIDQSAEEYEAFLYFATSHSESNTLCKHTPDEVRKLYELI